MRRARLLVVLLAAQGLPAPAQQPSQPPLANSPLIWEVRDGTHPRLGPIKVAVPTSSVVTPVGRERILSLVFLSCEKAKGLVAIELANAAESDARSGLYPRSMPKLFCNPRSTAPRSEIQATWFVSEIGDAMARGFAPSTLRRCASIDVEQDLALPRGWGAESKRVDIELIPYKKELDEVISLCASGPIVTAEAPKVPPKAAASAPAPTKPVAAMPAPTPAKPPSPPPKPAPAPPKAAPPLAPVVASAPAPVSAPAQPGEEPWREARTLPSGRTNIRAAPDIDARIVTMVDPGTKVLVQSMGTEWFRVKAPNGSFSGYIRQDRFAHK